MEEVVQYKIVKLLDSSTENMNVDGSSTPVSYQWVVPSTESWFLECVRVFILDPGSMISTYFGSLGSALTNGVDLKIKSFGCECTTNTIKNNVDLLMGFPHRASTGSTATGFLNEEDYFVGECYFNRPIRLNNSDGDFIKMVINDDLTGLTTLRACAVLWRPNP